MRIQITISTVHWNTPEKLIKTIDSFLATYSNDFDYTWYIIDNKSNGSSFKKIIEKYSQYEQIKFIENDINEGGLALNKLVDKAEGKYWVFLGPDTEQCGKTILSLINFMEKKKEAGIAAAYEYSSQGNLIYYYRRKNNFLIFLLFRTKFCFFLNKLLRNIIVKFVIYSHINPKMLNCVDQVSGACFVERMEILKDLGYVTDDNFPFYFNDVDQCKLVQDKKYKIYLVPNAKIIHDHGSSFKKRDKFWRTQELLKSMIKYYRKHYKHFLWMIKYILIFDRSFYFFLTILGGNKKEILKKKWLMKNILKW